MKKVLMQSFLELKMELVNLEERAFKRSIEFLMI